MLACHLASSRVSLRLESTELCPSLFVCDDNAMLITFLALASYLAYRLETIPPTVCKKSDYFPIKLITVNQISNISIYSRNAITWFEFPRWFWAQTQRKVMFNITTSSVFQDSVPGGEFTFEANTVISWRERKKNASKAHDFFFSLYYFQCGFSLISYLWYYKSTLLRLI